MCGMETLRGVAIIAYKNPRSPRFVVLRRKRNWEGWETPKGHLEHDDYEKTVKIELEEEAGISSGDIEEIQDMEEHLEWVQEDDGEKVERKYRSFLVRVSVDALIDVSGNPDEEHDQGYFFRYSDAKSLLTYDDNVELLEKAREMIEA